MKKLLTSLSIIAAVAVVVVGATGAFFSDTETSNGNTFTAGKLDLKIDSTCHYNGFVCGDNDTNYGEGNHWLDETGTKGDGEVPTPYVSLGKPCECTWDAKDLKGDTFFDYQDIKPGDWGENTISIHVDNNDAYGRVVLTAVENRENLCTGPEKGAEEENNLSGQATCSGRWCGELAQNMYGFVWVDNGDGNDDNTIGDNIYQDGEEIVSSCKNPIDGSNGVPFYCQVLSDEDAGHACDLASKDPQGDLPYGDTVVMPIAPDAVFLEGGVDNYLGVAWYVPTSVGNEVQSDSIKADISFEIVQARHNDGGNPFDVLP